MRGHRLIEKTDGNGNVIQVWEKVELDTQGRPIKTRRRTNLTPKKKKRKK